MDIYIHRGINMYKQETPTALCPVYWNVSRILAYSAVSKKL